MGVLRTLGVGIAARPDKAFPSPGIRPRPFSVVAVLPDMIFSFPFVGVEAVSGSFVAEGGCIHRF
jgi:hypothetical protein